MTTNMKEIDPALESLKEFGSLTGGVTEHIQAMRKQAIFTDGALPARHKALAAVLWSISARCEPCIKFYVTQAVRLGATEKELGEYLAVASTMGGCVGEMWALKAFHAYRNRDDDEPEASEPSCCVDP